MIRTGPRDWLRAQPRWADALIAFVVFLVAVLVPDPDRAGGPVFAPLTVGPVLLAAGTCAVLMARRGRPLAVLALTVLGTVASTVLVGERTLLVLAALVALYSVSVRGHRRTTRWVWAGTTLALSSAELLRQGAVDPEMLTTVAWTAVAASVGDALGHRRAYLAAVEERAVRAEQGREQESQRRVTEERLRIARELHDVVAHHMAVVNVQAGVASYLLPDQPAAAQEALGHVRRAAGEILAELGDILNVLRQGDEPDGPTAPAPGLAQLDGLVTSFTAAGLDVDWSLSGQPRELGGGVDLVAYRLLQEALTNAHKHGTGTAHVTVTYLPEQVQLQVSNPFPARAAAPVTSSDAPATGARTAGHGLVGMRERASAVSGTVQLGPDGDGQFLVQAVLPLPATSATGGHLMTSGT